MLLIATAALTATTPLAARDLVVVHKDLDLSSAKDRKVLEQRIDKSAREFCGVGRTLTGSRVQATGTMDCYRDARDAAREQMARLIEQRRLANR